MDDGTDAGLLPAPPSGWSDPLTGADGPRLWDRVVASEVARFQRSKHTATVVLVELAGMDEIARTSGPDVAERLFVKVGRSLAVEIRSSDHIARIDRTRFAMLLPETDEIEAINFVERARTVAEYHLRDHGEARVGIGWASPSESTDLRAAIDAAATRLQEELQAAS